MASPNTSQGGEQEKNLLGNVNYILKYDYLSRNTGIIEL